MGAWGFQIFKLKLWGQTPGTDPHSEDPLGSAGISWRLCLQVAERMPSHGPLIFILHQYLALGRWPLLTSGIQRRKNLIHVMCRPARLFEGNSGHVPHWARTQWFASAAAHKWSLKGSGNVLPNGPEKSHTNLQPWPAVNVSAHFPEALPTLAFIIFKISCNLLSWQWKHLTVFSFEFL